MPTSPFQQPSFRRNALASLIEEADQRGDTRELLLLKSQWVHRYGVDSMPTSSMVSEPIADWLGKEPLTTDVPESDQVEIDSSAIEAAEIEAAEIDAAEIDEPMPDELTIDNLNSDNLKQDEPEPEDFVAATQDPVSDQPPVSEHSPLSEQPSSGDPSAVDSAPSRPLTAVRSIPAVASIPAPPISTPRSLRRWLPGADDQLPKAS
ncbi:hypothetical protein [Synechococcus sp. CC9616]|uniref:hypothetical protein n=1 Tax=Synechococcus sp. CC9616 TaxID=110663 RepID=UPI00048E5043|nr:hypothetical protein [Synechococcus sp. CC9616]